MSENKRRYSLFPKSLQSCVEPLTRPVLKAHGLAGSRLIGQWEQVVGRELAARTLPEKISFPKGKTSGGTLTIAVENGFATELQYMQPVILERLAVHYGYKAITKIVISHSFTHAPEKPLPKKKKTAKKSMKAPDISEVSDPELKAALESLARTLGEA